MSEPAEISDRIIEALLPIATRSREDAEDAYRCLCNVAWVELDSKAANYDEYEYLDGTGFFTTWRSAGQIVAELRDEGEDYMDFYCSGREASITDEILESMKNVGLRPLIPRGWA